MWKSEDGLKSPFALSTLQGHLSLCWIPQASRPAKLSKASPVSASRLIVGGMLGLQHIQASTRGPGI